MCVANPIYLFIYLSSLILHRHTSIYFIGIFCSGRSWCKTCHLLVRGQVMLEENLYVYACKTSHQYSWSVFHTTVYKHTFSWSVDKREEREDSPTAQWKRHCDRTQFKQDVLMLFEEYRIYVSCVSEISKAHFCINLRLSAVFMQVVQTICQTNCSIDWYKYTLNNVEQDNMKYHRLKNMYGKASAHYKNNLTSSQS